MEKEHCLSTLIWTEWRTHERKASEYPILFLDEPFWPLEQARRFGFEDEMCAFMQKMFDAVGGIIKKKLVATTFHPNDYKLKIYDTIDVSVYDRAKYILLTEEELLEQASRISSICGDNLSKRNAAELDARVHELTEIKLAYENASKNPWCRYELREKDIPKPGDQIFPVSYIKKIAGVEGNTADEHDEVYSRIVSGDVDAFVKRERQRIDDERKERKRAEIADRRREKRLYRKPLPRGVVVPTEYP